MKEIVGRLLTADGVPAEEILEDKASQGPINSAVYDSAKSL